MGRVLIADNDDVVVNVIGADLRKAGFEVVTTCDGDEAIARLERDSFLLVVVGVHMRSADGFDVWKRLRQRPRPRLPVILLTDRSGEHDALRGLELGADDYLIRPFEPRALVARVHALLRRSGLSPTVSAGNVVLDREGLQLDVGCTRFQLSRLETSILGVLLSNVGRYVDAKTLMSETWGQSGARERKALKQAIYRLRRKLDRNPTASALLATSRGAGYCWHIQNSERAY